MKAIFDKATTLHIGEESYLCIGISHRDAVKFVGEMKQGKKYVAELKQYRQQRSRDANSYFHVLCDKIAEEQNLGLDEVKRNLVCEYGTVACDEEGEMIGFDLPASFDARKIYDYIRCIGTRVENGKEFNTYMVFKHTSDLDSKEFSRLIEGAVYEAKNLGIETLPPERLAAMLGEWENGG